MESAQDLTEEHHSAQLCLVLIMGHWKNNLTSESQMSKI